MAGSNGVLEAITPMPNNKVRYEWKSTYPISYYLISVAVAEYVDYTIYATPKGQNDSIKIVNYIYNNPQTLIYFKTEIDKTFEDQPEITLVHTELPLTSKEADIIVLPIQSLMHMPQEKKNWLPVIAHGPAEFLDMAFNTGCSDYLKQPWSMEELIHRVKKNVKSRSLVFPWGKVSITCNQVTTPFGAVRLSIQESAILKVLAQKQGDVVPRETLYYALWGKLKNSSRVVDMHISSLRKKLQPLLPNDFDATIIQSAHGSGYFILNC